MDTLGPIISALADHAWLLRRSAILLYVIAFFGTTTKCVDNAGVRERTMLVNLKGNYSSRLEPIMLA